MGGEREAFESRNVERGGESWEKVLPKKGTHPKGEGECV